MWGYMIGICMMVGTTEEWECQDRTFVPDFTSETACEVHSILQTSLINFDLYHNDEIYDVWVAPSECFNTKSD